METSEKRVCTQVAVSKSPAEWMRAGIRARCMAGCSMLVGACVYIVMARVLKPEESGTYLFVRWVASMVIPALGAGMSTLASRQIAAIQSRETLRMSAGIFYFLWYRQHKCIIFYSICFTFCSFVSIFLLHIGTATQLFLAGLATLPLMLSTVAGTTLRSLRKSDLLALLNLFAALLTLFLFCIAAQISALSSEVFLLTSGLVNALTLILALLCLIRQIPFKKALQPGIFLQERLEHCLKRSWLQFLVDAIIWEQAEFLLLAYWCTPAEIGYYALSTLSSAAVIKMLPSLFANWVLPLLTRFVPAYHYRSTCDALIKNLCYLTLLVIPLCVTLICFCPDLIMLILGSAYLPMVLPLRIMLIAAASGSLATIGVTMLANGGQAGRLKWPHIGVAGLKILLAVPCILFWGITGAAIASAIAQIASASISLLLCWKMLKGHVQAKNIA